MSKLETNIIAPSTGTTITIGESGDTVALGSGATQTGFGGTNTPAFSAYFTSNQSISHSTLTKVQFNTEHYDTDSAYDNTTNYRFTPQTSGKYFVSAYVRLDGTQNPPNARIELHKNGSLVLMGQVSQGSSSRAATPSLSGTVSLNGSTDYLEIFFIQDSGVSMNLFAFSGQGNLFQAYKIIE